MICSPKGSWKIYFQQTKVSTKRFTQFPINGKSWAETREGIELYYKIINSVNLKLQLDTYFTITRVQYSIGFKAHANSFKKTVTNVRNC